MTWNGPGNGQNDKDPWGRRKQSESGPPDLDELWRKFVQRFKRYFKRNDPPSNDGGYTSDEVPPFAGMGLIALVILGLWFLSGIFIVAPAEKAVILRFGRYVDTLGAGPHWIPSIIDKKYIVNVENVENYAYGDTKEPVYMLTKDANIVTASVAVWFRISNPRDYLFNVLNPKMSLQQATASALRQSVGQNTLDDILTVGRAVIRQQVEQQLNAILQRYNTGIQVTKVALQSAAAPQEVKDKFDDAIRAQEDEQRYINQARAYAASVNEIAKGKAQRMLQEASAYKEQVILQAKGDTSRFLALLPHYKRAPQVTRQRLYLETMESVLSKSTKVVIDGKENNSLMYLPFDKLIDAWSQRATATTSAEEDRENVIHEPETPTPSEAGIATKDKDVLSALRASTSEANTLASLGRNAPTVTFSDRTPSSSTRTERVGRGQAQVLQGGYSQ